MVDQAQCAGHEAVLQSQRRAGIKADRRIPDDLRVVGKPLVHKRVLDHENVVSQEGVRAERDISRGLVGIQPGLALEALQICADDRDEADRHIESVDRELHGVIEGGFLPRPVEPVPGDRFRSRERMGGARRLGHLEP